jgi:hypothetical protein
MNGSRNDLKRIAIFIRKNQSPFGLVFSVHTAFVTPLGMSKPKKEIKDL